VVSGTVAYRERIALPPDAVAEVLLSDVSKMDVAAPVIAKTTVLLDGQQVPLTFALGYDSSSIEPNHTYAVRAVILSAGRVIFTTDRAYPVITRGNPTHVDLLLVRVSQEAVTSEIWGTKWLLEDLGGAGVLDRVQATLEFIEAGKVAGHGSCNRFFGAVEISGESINFSSLGSTRMSCAEAVMMQESNYLKALEGAERFTFDGSVLLIYSKEMDEPLRFTRPERASATATPDAPVIGAFRAIGTEPFWSLDINSAGLRFTTPDDMTGIRFPPLAPTVRGDTLRWAGETERAAIDARIWPSRCSDGMSDRVWTHKAVVRIDGLIYRGCADASPETASSSNPIGEWVIVSHRIPGISAMTNAEAAQWHGGIVRLGTREAMSRMDTCRQPMYRYHTALADSLLHDEFHVAPADLGLQDTARLGVTEVFCGDARWTAMGGLLIWVAENRPYTVWDGVFFELRRLADGPGRK
jgi:putative lipoprotein